MKVFYSDSLNLTVTDIRGIKNISDMETTYGGTDWQGVILAENESYEIKNKILKKIDLDALVASKKAAKELEKKQKKDSIKIKLGLNENEFTDLKIALGLE